MEINQLMEEAHQTACQNGWHDGRITIGDQLSNIHAEVSEAWEEFRIWGNNGVLLQMRKEKDKPVGFPVELADVMIRVCDLCQELGIDLEEAIRLKMEYNRSRDHRHGGKAA